jgi:hypothetical protein
MSAEVDERVRPVRAAMIPVADLERPFGLWSQSHSYIVAV